MSELARDLADLSSSFLSHAHRFVPTSYASGQVHCLRLHVRQVNLEASAGFIDGVASSPGLSFDGSR
jgi:hypothetical protein